MYIQIDKEGERKRERERERERERKRERYGKIKGGEEKDKENDS